jgi:hypothetical protein
MDVDAIPPGVDCGAHPGGSRTVRRPEGSQRRNHRHVGTLASKAAAKNGVESVRENAKNAPAATVETGD